LAEGANVDKSLARPSHFRSLFSPAFINSFKTGFVSEILGNPQLLRYAADLKFQTNPVFLFVDSLGSDVAEMRGARSDLFYYLSSHRDAKSKWSCV